MKKTTIAGLALCIVLAAPAAEAKLSCYPLKQVEQALGTEYGERQSFSGRDAAGEASGVEYRLYVNADTGSWTWVGIPAGSEIGCLIFAGKIQEAPGKSDVSVAPAPRAAEF